MSQSELYFMDAVFGHGRGRDYDEYRIRSAYAAALSTNYSFPEPYKRKSTPVHLQG